jgi:hypothetical protein
MWLERFHALFGVATERRAGRAQDLSRVEEQLLQGRHEWRVGQRELEIIETSDGWDYPKWWPRISSHIERPITLPTHIYSAQGKRTAIEDLHDVLKNIEIVSVVMRFMCPEAFGIISPPVTSFLCFFPASSPVDYYLHYLKVLNGFVEHYGVFGRVADIDMALWSAAHLSLDPAYASVSEEMRNDEYLQEVRLANLIAGLGQFWRRSEMQRVVFARMLLEHDHVLGSVIGARVYESVLREMMEYYGLLKGVFDKIDLTLVRQLERRSEIVSLGLRPSELEALWKLRHEAVHGYLGFTVKKAKLFEQGVEEVWRAWRKRSSKSR